MALITFGCSFTNYGWLTWSDIIAEDLGCEYENWGHEGIGNNAIARRIMYRKMLGFNKDDIVIVQWTFPSREDRYIDKKWVANGSVFNEHGGMYGSTFVKKYWDWDNDLINTAHSRISTEAILGDYLKCQFGVQESDNSILNLPSTEVQQFLNQYESILPNCQSGPSFQGIHVSDWHPDPMYWLKWIENVIYPNLGLKLKDTTKQKIGEYYNLLIEIVKHSYVNLSADERNFYISKQASELTQKMNIRTNKTQVGQFININTVHNLKVLF